MTPLAYLIKVLKNDAEPGAFTKEYSKLPEPNKTMLKRWAMEEMTHLGFEVN